MRNVCTAVAVLLVVAACQPTDGALPAPQRAGAMSVEEALARRRSVRAFSPGALTAADLGQLLWSAQGITDRRGFRTAPSAGALFPLEAYVAVPQGLYHYDPRRHRVELRRRGDLRGALARAALDQDVVAYAPAVFVLTGIRARTAGKYGRRAARYVYMEAGHAAQNLLLQATTRGLVGVPIGAFDDGQMNRALSLPAGEEALYLIPIGKP